VGYKLTIGDPKSGHGRNISLDPGTVAALRALHKQQLEEQIRWKKAGYVDSGLVLRKENGQTYHPDLISQKFQKAVRDSKQPRVRLHDLRHTHATLALQAGIHPKVVQERLGRASIQITLDLYSHAIPAMHEEAAAKVAALFMP
jgi:integrase